MDCVHGVVCMGACLRPDRSKKIGTTELLIRGRLTQISITCLCFGQQPCHEQYLAEADRSFMHAISLLLVYR